MVKGFLIALIFCSVAGSLYSQIFLEDQFEGNDINLSKWRIDLPRDYSPQVYQSSGSVFTSDRGIISTIQSFNPNADPYDIVGRFSVLTSDSVFAITLRSDPTTLNTPDSEPIGIRVGFWNNGGTNGLTIGGVAANASYGPEIEDKSITFPLGTYDFKIRDLGSSISVFLSNTDTPNLTLSVPALSGYLPGNKISFFSSQSNDSNSIDFIKVQAVPEPNSSALILASMLIYFKKRKFSAID